MCHSQTRPHHKLHHKVPIADAIQAVLRYALESELLGEKEPVDDEGVACEGAGAKREDGDAGDELAETGEVGGEGKGVGEEEVRPADWLAALHDICKPVKGYEEEIELPANAYTQA